jgi:hemoglobin
MEAKRDIEDREDIDRLMVRFYTAALSDEKIGYLFTEVAKLDLEEHLPVIGDFWETILFQTGAYSRYGRTPLMVHGDLNEKSPLLFDHFVRWLELFEASVDAEFEGGNADFIKSRAHAIANRMFMYVSTERPVSAVG